MPCLGPSPPDEARMRALLAGRGSAGGRGPTAPYQNASYVRDRARGAVVPARATPVPRRSGLEQIVSQCLGAGNAEGAQRGAALLMAACDQGPLPPSTSSTMGSRQPCMLSLAPLTQAALWSAGDQDGVSLLAMLQAATASRAGMSQMHLGDS